MINEELYNNLKRVYNGRKAVIVCIGTDGNTGDSLGPLVGQMLIERGYPMPVYGTLDDPIHAMNANRKVKDIKDKHRKNCIFAIDAVLGTSSKTGDILFRKGEPVAPGLAVGRNLQPVGDHAILGVTTISRRAISENTVRLRVVYKMAVDIVDTIMQVHGEWVAKRITIIDKLNFRKVNN